MFSCDCYEEHLKRKKNFKPKKIKSAQGNAVQTIYCVRPYSKPPRPRPLTAVASSVLKFLEEAKNDSPSLIEDGTPIIYSSGDSDDDSDIDVTCVKCESDDDGEGEPSPEMEWVTQHCVVCDGADSFDRLDLNKCSKCLEYFHYSKGKTCNSIFSSTGKCVKCEKMFCGVNECEDFTHFYDLLKNSDGHNNYICRACVNDDGLWDFMMDKGYDCYESAKKYYGLEMYDTQGNVITEPYVRGGKAFYFDKKGDQNFFDSADEAEENDDDDVDDDDVDDDDEESSGSSGVTLDKDGGRHPRSWVKRDEKIAAMRIRRDENIAAKKI